MGEPRITRVRPADEPRLLWSITDVDHVCQMEGLTRDPDGRDEWVGLGVLVQGRPGSHLGWVRVATADRRLTLWTGNVGDDASSADDLRAAIDEHVNSAGQLPLALVGGA